MITFASGLEKNLWKDMKRKLGRRKFPKAEYETEKLKYVLVKNYIPDFVLTKRDGKKIYIEVKGYLRPADRTKMKAVKQLDPDLDIRIVFAKDNKIYKNSKTLYSDWAKKNNFPYSIGEIPRSWLNS